MRDFFVESEESSDKATIFLYNEVRDATSNFSASLKIGQGSYGSVYLGKLRGTVRKRRHFLISFLFLCLMHAVLQKFVLVFA